MRSSTSRVTPCILPGSLLKSGTPNLGPPFFCDFPEDKTDDNGKPIVWPKSLQTYFGGYLLKDSRQRRYGGNMTKMFLIWLFFGSCSPTGQFVYFLPPLLPTPCALTLAVLACPCACARPAPHRHPIRGVRSERSICLFFIKP